MTIGNKIIIIGLFFNTLASIVALYPFMQTIRKVEDDLITHMDKSGRYTQRKHLKDRRLGMCSLILLAIGFVLQIIGMFVQ
jgi:hypothetical protein